MHFVVHFAIGISITYPWYREHLKKSFEVGKNLNNFVATEQINFLTQLKSQRKKNMPHNNLTTKHKEWLGSQVEWFTQA